VCQIAVESNVNRWRIPDMSLWEGRPYIAIRVLGKRGQYPAFELRTPSHLYVPSPAMTWTAALQPALPEDWEWGELSVLAPEEVRLLSAITLCEANPFGKGLPIIAHWKETHLDPAVVGFDLSSEATFRSIELAVASLPIEPEPPEERRFQLRTDLGTREDAIELLRQMDGTDQLLLAGLARLLGASRVMLVAGEHEEGAISLFIAMGAALELIRLCLAEEAGKKSVPFSAVSDYLASTHPDGHEIAEYFEDAYEHRVIATHPASRFGEFWAPPLMMSQVFHLQKSLMGLYRHIILGEVRWVDPVRDERSDATPLA
jgi:hypothetical protein